MQTLIEILWINEITPEERHTAKVSPIYKKGDPLESCNYRQISLLNASYKILSNILYTRLVLHTEEIIEDYQRGFRVGLRLLIAFSTETGIGINLHLLFIDFKQDYNTVGTECLYQTLREILITNRLVNLVKMALID
jgi:hypothetical protein